MFFGELDGSALGNIYELKTKEYNPNITDITVYLPDNFYHKEFTSENIVNNNPQITKLSLHYPVMRLLIARLDGRDYLPQNILYYFDRVNFRELFPNVTELIVDVGLLHNIDYSKIIGTIKKITIVANSSSSKFVNVLCTVWINKHPEILYEVRIKNSISDYETFNKLIKT